MDKNNNDMAGTIWAILAVLFFVAQFVTGVFDLVFIAAAALLVATAAAIIPGFGDSAWLQILFWVAGSFGSVYLFRKKFRHLFRGEELQVDKSLHAGQKAKVIEAIGHDTPGRITFHGTSWEAASIGEEIPAGAEVYILEQEGMSFTVSQRFLEDAAPEIRLDSPQHAKNILADNQPDNKKQD